MPVRPDANHHADAREAAVQALARTLGAEFQLYRYLPAGLWPRAFLLRVANRQLSALLALPAPTRAALLGGP